MRDLASALAERYAIVRELGEGGMATVYLARDLRHERNVALKVLRPELAAVIGAERFLAEIRTTANLQHPGILPLFDSGEAAGQLFYVMPYVDGESLRARLDRERQLPIADAVRIAAEAGDALAYAHKQGVIHRDIKPENILLQSGRPLVADFGIALALQQAGGNRLTQTGLSLGTPQYMSPEQAGGERNVDGRADEYALASVLFEMLAGEPPFSAPNTQALIARLMTEEPRPLEQLRRNVPPNVADAVHRALEKLPADRFTTVDEFVRGLSADVVQTRRAAGSRNAAPSRRAGLVAVAILIAGVVVGALGHRIATRSAVAAAPSGGRTVRFIVDPDSGSRLNLTCCGNFFVVSPAGDRMAFIARDGDSESRIHVRALDSLTSRPLPGTENAHELFFSPGGDAIGFIAGRVIRTVDLKSGVARTIGQLPPTGFTGGGTWTDKGTIIYSVGNRLFELPAGGGDLKQIFSTDSTKGDLQIGGPWYLVGQRAVLFTVQRALGEAQVSEFWLDSKKSRVVAPGVTPNFVSAGGYLLTTRGDNTLEARRFNPVTGDSLGPARRIAEGVAIRSPVLLYAEYTSAANGTFIVSRRGRSEATVVGALHIISNGTDDVHSFPVNGASVTLPRFSRDGSHIVVVSPDLRRRIASAAAYDPQRRALTRLPNPQHITVAAWNANGDSVYSANSAPEIVVQAADGSGAPRRVAQLAGWGEIRSLDVTPAGIVFSAQHNESTDVGIIERSGSVRSILSSPANEEAAYVSPDGKHIAFTVIDGGRTSVQVAAFPSLGDRIAVAEADGRDPRWTRDGTLVYVDSAFHVVAATFQPNGQPAPTRRVLGSIPRNVVGWDIDPAGKRIVYAAPQGAGGARLIVTVNGIP